jgi:galactokinase/mevalonate kinase-like predicted kinase
MKHLISVPPGVVPHFHEISGLPAGEWFVGADPTSARVGSGGGTSWLLSENWKSEKASGFETWLKGEKRIIIHAGGQGRRLPAYSLIGKSLLPMPVFRWSRGQDLNQRLIHLQTPLFEKIIENAPAELNTLVASGDTLIFPGKRLPEIPQADIVCFGLWLEPEKATGHGVFFTSFENPEQLQFMLQKPSISKIQELVQHYYFLMDIGIWLLSRKAVDVLMKKSGWNGNGYADGIPREYDMYSTFGAALGTNPEKTDSEINVLKVAVVNLEGGEFYHMGNTSELITSNLAIQNRVTNQREIWHKYIKPHPSVFVLNAEINNRFTTEHRNIWVENAHIPDLWLLSQNHCLTGIPENQWNLKLKADDCLDMVPLDNNRFILRNYGFNDKFIGRVGDEKTYFSGQPLLQWLESHSLEGAGFDREADIQHVPLFPVLKRTEISEEFIQWLLDDKPQFNKKFVERWLLSDRFSAAEISDIADLLLSEKQRRQNRINNISQIAKNYRHSVFYQLDLKRLSAEFVSLGLPLPEIPDVANGDWMAIHNSMFRAVCKKTEGQEDETKAFSLLSDSILEKFKKNTVEPCIDLLPDQIAWGRSPVRLDIAGGWTDTPPYCMLYGGKVVNIAVGLNGQPPLHCYIRAIEKPEIVLRSIDLGAREQITSFDELLSFQNIQSAFSIPRAALALSGFHPDFSHKKYTSLEQQLKALGGGLEISILSAVPKGSGLGTSSILAATILGTLSNVCRLNWDKMEIGSRVLALEQLLTTGGGWQDQFGGLLEGIKLLETFPGKGQEPTVKWLPDTLFTAPETKNRMLLYYTGITRVAKNILADIVRGMFLNSSSHLSILGEMKQHAELTAEILLGKDYNLLGQQIRKSWILNQHLDAGTNTPEIQQIIDKIEPLIIGQKLLGAGGGGFMLIFAKDEEAAVRIKNTLSANPTNLRARFLDFEISQKGFQVTRS